MSENNFYSMTLLNSTGDITLTWEDHEDEEMKAMIQKKIDQGFNFFIIEPRSGFLKILGKKKTTIKDVGEIKYNKVSMETDEVNAAELFKNIDFKIGDADAERMFKKGKVGISNVPSDNYSTVRKAKTVQEVIKNHTIGFPKIVAG